MAGDYREASVDARRLIAERNRKELADCDRVRDYAVGMFENWTGRGLESTADGLIAAIFARSIDTFTCAIRCVRLGYGAQAAMLNRSLFEDMVDIHWIPTAPEDASDRYDDHDDHGKMLLAETLSSFRGWYPDLEIPEYDAKERKRLDDLFGKYGERPWSTLNLHTRVGLIREHWKSEHDHEVLRFMHAVAHRENNQLLHVTAHGLGTVVEVDDTGRPEFRVGPRVDMVRRALFGAYWTFTQTATLMIDHFGFPMSAEERGAMFTMQNFDRPDEPKDLRF